MFDTDAQRLRIAITGDWLLTRPLSIFNEPEYLALRELLTDSDVVFANLEAPIQAPHGTPYLQAGGATYVTAEPALLDELKWFGVNLLACGSHHADDHGPQGIVDTIEFLDAARIVHAGSGRNLAEARAPGYLDTAHGRVALVAACAGYRSSARAGEQRRDTLGSPGINGLRQHAEYCVDAESFAALRSIGDRLGIDGALARERGHAGQGFARDDQRYEFLGSTFIVSGEPAIHTSCNRSDLEANLKAVEEAKYFADYVVVSLHSHAEGGEKYGTASLRSELDEIAEFALEFGHRCIDAGADVFVTHGPQVPLGVEIYKGKPFFHGIGAFVFEIETVRHHPSEAYEAYGLADTDSVADFIRTRYNNDSIGHPADRAFWEQMVAICDFVDGSLDEIRLYPLELGYERPLSQRGRPLPATEDAAERILSRVARCSALYDTPLEIREGIGIVRPK